MEVLAVGVALPQWHDINGKRTFTYIIPAPLNSGVIQVTADGMSKIKSPCTRDLSMHSSLTITITGASNWVSIAASGTGATGEKTSRSSGWDGTAAGYKANFGEKRLDAIDCAAIIRAAFDRSLKSRDTMNLPANNELLLNMLRLFFGRKVLMLDDQRRSGKNAWLAAVRLAHRSRCALALPNLYQASATGFNLDGSPVHFGYDAKASREYEEQGRDHDVRSCPDTQLMQNLITPDHNMRRSRASLPVEGRLSAFYNCGPQAFEETMRAALADLGVPAPMIRSEHFETGGAAEVPDSEEAVVHFTKSNVQATWTKDQPMTILELAERAGLNPDFGCRMGARGSCSFKLICGTTTGGMQPDGNIYICSAMPLAPQIEIGILKIPCPALSAHFADQKEFWLYEKMNCDIAAFSASVAFKRERRWYKASAVAIA
ncbi:hypothetical protein K469DRAFT_767678 [Zopfia rhizophila CBS 207.26]|uniref:Uncharacterized protein n=1 Tax=Zopfia rhizophila CBS 207.26 TaxID=1314779 RepID=A0A6A6EEM4_9PEZI|nr:hypothetical protein K469DRAFT_767678 [Zopfia rhizophila CBS 207.26]